MLQVRPDRPLSPPLLALIRTLDSVATRLRIPDFVIGATARDVLMEHVYALETTRATRDVDFAVAVRSWEVFAELKTQVIGTGAKLAAHWPNERKIDKFIAQAKRSSTITTERATLLVDAFLNSLRH